MRLCALASGSSGNCVLVKNKKTTILVDAGLSGKRIVEKLQEVETDVKEIDAILVTHEHLDHIQGVGVLSRKYDLPIWANELTWEAMNVGKIKEENKCILPENNSLQIGDLQVENFPISHDAVEPVGYSFYAKEEKATVLTDTGFINEEMESRIAESDLIVLESNHDVEMLKTGPYPYHLKRRIMGQKGHLSNEQAGKTLQKIADGDAKQVLLAHLSKENNFPQLAFLTVKNILLSEGIEIEKDMRLELTYADKPSKILTVKKE